MFQGGGGKSVCPSGCGFYVCGKAIRMTKKFASWDFFICLNWISLNKTRGEVNILGFEFFF
jgi:hypothetical protein